MNSTLLISMSSCTHTYQQLPTHACIHALTHTHFLLVGAIVFRPKIRLCVLRRWRLSEFVFVCVGVFVCVKEDKK